MVKQIIKAYTTTCIIHVHVYYNETYITENHTSKGSSLPGPAGDQLEWPGGNLLAGGCHPDNGGHTPPLVARLQGRSLST